MNEWLSNYYPFFLVAIGASCVGFLTGLLSSFVYFRKQSLLADAASHASLPGVACALLLFPTDNIFVLLCAGATSSILGICLIYAISALTTLKKDTILGLILSVFFGCGIVLMTIMQKRSLHHRALLHKILFGNISTLLLHEVFIIVFITLVVLSLIVFFWKEFFLVTFDHHYAYIQGYSRLWLEVLLTGMLTISIIIGLQTVGIVLMSSMFIGPAVAARCWTRYFSGMVIIAAGIGSASGCLGALLSCLIDRLPAGPCIILLISVCVFFSLMVNKYKNKKKVF